MGENLPTLAYNADGGLNAGKVAKHLVTDIIALIDRLSLGDEI